MSSAVNESGDSASMEVSIHDSERRALDGLLALTETTRDEAFWVADFLLAWLENREFAGFDASSVRQMDGSVLSSVLTVVALISRTKLAPHALGYGPQFELLRTQWR